MHPLKIAAAVGLGCILILLIIAFCFKLYQKRDPLRGLRLLDWTWERACKSAHLPKILPRVDSNAAIINDGDLNANDCATPPVYCVGDKECEQYSSPLASVHVQRH